MIAQVIDRGNLVEFTANFLDADGIQVEPASVVGTVNFLNSEGARENASVAMTEQSDGTWYGTWDSEEAQPARTYWNIRSTAPESSEDGYFELKGNLANLATP